LTGFTGYWEKLEKLRGFATARSLSMVEFAIAEQVAQTAAAVEKQLSALDRMELDPLLWRSAAVAN
jgi:hypothetical protein